MRAFLIVLFTILPSYLAIDSLAYDYGYCSLQKRFLNEDEKLKKVIEAINQKKSVSLSKVVQINGQERNYYYHQPRVSYKNTEDFLQKNKDCCHLQPAGRWERLLNALGGAASTQAKVNYRAIYRNDDGQEDYVEKQEWVEVDACGYVPNNFD